MATEAPDRMSSLDAFFFYTEEDGRNHMHVGGLALVEGLAPTAEEVAASLGERLRPLPRYRQLARPFRLHVNRPVWVPAPDFDVRQHVQATTADSPDRAGLRRALEQFISTPLDHSRPLWEVLVVDGINDGPAGWAIAWKIHHSMVDGVSGTELLTILFDGAPQASTADPLPLPSGSASSAAGAVTDLVRDALHQVGSVRPATIGKAVRVARSGLAITRRTIVPDVRSPLVGRIGKDRAFDWCSVPFEDVQRIRATLGGTVNDVVLTAVLDGFRALLLGRGLNVKGKGLRLMAPVALRSRDASGTPLGDGTMSTKASALMPRLPLDVEDPVQRLKEVAGQLERLKATSQAEAVTAINEVAAVLPGTVTAVLMRAMSAVPQRSLHTTVTNVHGPTVPLSLLGRRLLTIGNYAPPFPVGARSSVTVYSYGGNLVFGVTTDRDSLPDVDVLVNGIRSGLSELLSRAED